MSGRSSDYWRGNPRILGDYSGNSSSFNNVLTSHYNSGNVLYALVPTHWTCPRRRNPKFVPQEESIEDILSRPRTTLAELGADNFDGIAFYGRSGVGKTEAAIQFIEKYRWHTYDVFWVDASTPTTLTKDFQHIPDLLKNSATTHTDSLNWVGKDVLQSAKPTDKRLPIPDDPTSKTTAMKNTDDSTTANDISGYQSLLSAAKSELESPSRRSWLLVLDNLTDETVITEFLPKSPNGKIIVTTRSLNLASGLGCRVVEVPRMSPTNAVSLFKTNYRNPGELEMKQDEVMELMELLEHLPARIVDAALHMSESRVSVREYLAKLKAARGLAEKRSRPWRHFGLGGVSGRWNGAAVAGCFVVFSVLLAWAIGFRRG